MKLADYLKSYWFCTGGVTSVDENGIQGWVRYRHPRLRPPLNVYAAGRKLGSVNIQGDLKQPPEEKDDSSTEAREWTFTFPENFTPSSVETVEVRLAVKDLHIAGSPWFTGDTAPPVAYAFMHIPKTAGTSLRALLEDHLGANAMFPSRDYLHMSGGNYMPVSQLQGCLEGRSPEVTTVAGHYKYEALRLAAPHAKMLTMVRSPDAQILSLLKHRKAKSGRSFKSLAYAEDGSVRPQFCDSQTRYFFSSPEVSELQTFIADPQARPQAIEMIKRRLSEFALVGISERFSESCARLAKILGQPLPSRKVLNKSAIATDDEVQNIANHLLESNALDVLLYETALDCFEGV